MMSESATHAAIEAIARNSYGRLIAYIAARSVAGAEDTLGDAIAAALERWPADGVPQKPEAWLLHAARNASLTPPVAIKSTNMRKPFFGTSPRRHIP